MFLVGLVSREGAADSIWKGDCSEVGRVMISVSFEKETGSSSTTIEVGVSVVLFACGIIFRNESS